MKTVIIETPKTITRTTQKIWDKIKHKYNYTYTYNSYVAVYVKIFSFKKG
jgi:hypothetical protein